jgi:8-oxo-dGTP diphosphatase
MTSIEDCFHLGVKGLILNPEKEILLLERNHPSKCKYWDIPGGRLQKGESQLDTLKREIFEETGLENIHHAHYLSSIVTNIRIPQPKGDVGLIFSLYVIYLNESFVPRLSSEHQSYAWCENLQACERLKSQLPREFISKLFIL